MEPWEHNEMALSLVNVEFCDRPNSHPTVICVFEVHVVKTGNLKNRRCARLMSTRARNSMSWL